MGRESSSTDSGRKRVEGGGHRRRDASTAMDRLPTGIDSLDRLLEGGIPRGSLVTFAAPPNSQAEMLVHELAAVRPTVYLTTIRPAAAVRDSLERADVSLETIGVRAIGPASLAEGERSGRTMLDEARAAIDGLPSEATVIVDPVDAFEWTGTEAYLHFLNDLRAALARSGGVGFLHCLDGRRVSDQRDLTDYVSDVAFQLSTTINEDGIDSRLAVPKFRGQRAFQETVKLDLSEDVTVDMSRNIA